MTGALSITPAVVEAATGQNAAEMRTLAEAIKAAGTSKDPKVVAALKKLADQTRSNAAKTETTNDTGRQGVRTINASDQSSAARARALATLLTGTGAGQTGTIGSMAPQMAQQALTQMPQMAQQMMPQVTQMAQPVSTSYAPGTVFVTQSQLRQLLDGVGSTGSSGTQSTPWNGTARPAPLKVHEVAYERRVGKMSAAQRDAAIEGALDKTGVTDPQARAKWTAVLRHMSEHESGNDAAAVNTSDSNAVGARQVDGAPAGSSRGAWQTIPATFAANHAAGTSNNIYDPEANAAAAINYMMNRYNIKPDGSGLDEFYARRGPGAYVGY